jgi:CrcB protein
MVVNPFFPPVVADAAAIGVGAVCGALCRHHIGQSVTKQLAKDPKRFGHLTGWHTAGINVVGSFILGGIFASPVATAESAPALSTVPANAASFGLTARAKLLAGVGFCGSFTTFSTYSVDIVNMIGRGEAARALGYIGMNNIGGVGAAAAGMLLVRKMIAGK